MLPQNTMPWCADSFKSKAFGDQQIVDEAFLWSSLIYFKTGSTKEEYNCLQSSYWNFINQGRLNSYHRGGNWKSNIPPRARVILPVLWAYSSPLKNISYLSKVAYIPLFNHLAILWISYCVWLPCMCAY